MKISFTGRNLQVSTLVTAEVEKVWDCLVDTEAWVVWGPSVKAVRADTRRIHPGSSGQVQTPVGLWLPFTVTRYIENHYWEWSVCGVEATGHWVQPEKDGTTRVGFIMPKWAVFYLPVCSIALRNIRKICVVNEIIG